MDIVIIVVVVIIAADLTVVGERSHFAVVGQRVDVVNGVDSIAVPLNLSYGAGLSTINALLTIRFLLLNWWQLLFGVKLGKLNG